MYVGAFGADYETIGSWSGKLQVNSQISLRIVFNIDSASVTIDSPDQNAYGIPAKLSYLSNDSVRISAPLLMVQFAGGLHDDKIEGIFKQGGKKFGLSLERGVKKLKRPQMPKPPFPYTERDVIIEAPEATLSATLCIPQGATADTPLAVLVSGSGLQDRNEEVFEHRPFAVIADFMARHGIASLRYDDRGFGKSKGSVDKATTTDFASDASAVVDYARALGRFGSIGIIGHSEGGEIGYILGAQGKIDFIVSIAGPTVKGTKIIAYQNSDALRKSGVEPGLANDFGIALERVLEYRLAHGTVGENEADDVLSLLFSPDHISPEMLNLSHVLRANLTSESPTVWMEHFLKYDPADDIALVKIPIFFVFGEKDCQVPSSLNAEAARTILPNAEIKVYSSLNHLMQHCTTGAIDEYVDIEETISSEVLEDIVSFIND